MDNKETNIVLFDGICNLCNKAVQFIISRDRKAKFRFASLQSEAGTLLSRQIGLPSGSNDSLVYIMDKRFFIKSAAVLQILRRLGGGWRLLFGLIIIPWFLRDLLYDFVAQRRYRYFGKSESCMIPAPQYKGRFLE
jgi:predicted DCC family thiol-disulfide oxidoreductase YuxK